MYSRETLEEVFRPWLECLATLLRDTISRVRAVKPRAAGIALIGGGAGQPAVKDFLDEEVLEPFNEEVNLISGIKLFFLPNPQV